MLSGQRSLLAVLLSVAIVLGAVAGAATADTVQPPPLTSAIVAQLRAIVVARASRLGDPVPTPMEAVASISHTAEFAIFSGFDGSPPAPVYVACASGTFPGTLGLVPPPSARHPRHARPSPPAKAFCLLLTSPGLFVEAIGLRSGYPDLSTLGPVQSLDPESSPSAATLAELRATLLAQAQAHGAARLTRLRAVETTSAAAKSQLPTLPVASGNPLPVYVACGTGRFRSRGVSSKLSAATLCIVVPATPQTGRGNAATEMSHYPKLSWLGTPHKL